MAKNRNIAFLSLLFIGIISICSCCPNNDDDNRNLKSDRISWAIPYTEFQQLRFLKNGHDTILYKGQGFNYYSKSYHASSASGCSRKVNEQCVDYKMYHSDNEFFQISLVGQNFANSVYVVVNNSNMLVSGWGKNERTSADSIYQWNNFYTIDILGHTYDSLQLSTNIENTDSIIFRPDIGVIMMNVQGNRYELIRWLIDVYEDF
jgi:hypothetical protein